MDAGPWGDDHLGVFRGEAIPVPSHVRRAGAVSVSEILGIRQEKGSVRYDRVEIAPRIPAGLDHACGRITTPHGEIVVDWCKEGGKVRLAVTVPESLRAVLRFQGQETVLAAGSSVVEG